MTTPQEPIGSGFGARSTAAEVLDGIDLQGTLALVTGGYSGIGIEAVRALSGAGAEVIVPARRPDAARDQLAGIDRVAVAELDLSDLDSVRALADQLLAAGRPLEIVIDCAGVMAAPETRVGGGRGGWREQVELQFATNHLGHYALVNRIWPLLAQRGARVVALSSGAHRRSPIRWDDLQFEHGYDKWLAYAQSKTADVLFAVELDRRGAAAGVRAFAVDPGGILTPLQRHLPQAEMVALGWIDEDGNTLIDDFKTPEQGASTMTWGATSPQLDGLGGVFLQDCEVAEINDADDGYSGVRSWAIDPDQARRLWELSAQLTGVDAFA